MRAMRRSSSSLIMILVCLLSVNNQAFATSGGAKADVAGMREFLSSHGVRAEVQERLIADVLSGKQLEAGKNVDPVRVSETRRDGLIVTVREFSDGSISVSEVSDLALARTNSARGIGVASVSGCSFSGSPYAGYWTNCIAKESRTEIAIAYRFDYSNTQSTGARITGYRGAGIDTFLGTFSEGKFERISNTEVRYTGLYTYYGGLKTLTTYLRTSVSGNVASTYLKF